MDASHVYVRALALGCFYSHINTRTVPAEGADRVAGQLRGDKECPFSGVTKSSRVWRKVPESDARSVTWSVPTAVACPHSWRLPVDKYAFFVSLFSILFFHSYNNFNVQQTRELISARKMSQKYNN